MGKWPYLSPEVTNLKNKGTLFSSTLKVKEKKVPLFFRLGASGLRYGHFHNNKMAKITKIFKIKNGGSKYNRHGLYTSKLENKNSF